jgi:hypothetical protein
VDFSGRALMVVKKVVRPIADLSRSKIKQIQDQTHVSGTPTGMVNRAKLFRSYSAGVY